MHGNDLLGCDVAHLVELRPAARQSRVQLGYSYWVTGNLGERQRMNMLYSDGMNVCTIISSVRIRIRDPVPFWPLDPGSGMSRKSASGSGIQDEQPGSYFLELRNHFLGLKYLNSLMRIRDGDSSDPGWKKVGSGIRDKHPGSATLIISK